MQSIGQPAFPTGAIVAKSYRRACQLMGRLLDPEMNILVDELADYHSWLLGSYKEKPDTQNDMITAMLCGVSVRDDDMIRM